MLSGAKLAALCANLRQSLLLGLRKLAELRAHRSLLACGFQQSLLLRGAQLTRRSRELCLTREIRLRSRLGLAVPLREELSLLRQDVALYIAQGSCRVGHHTGGGRRCTAARAKAKLTGAQITPFDFRHKLFAQRAGTELSRAVDDLGDIGIHVRRDICGLLRGLAQQRLSSLKTAHSRSLPKEALRLLIHRLGSSNAIKAFGSLETGLSGFHAQRLSALSGSAESLLQARLRGGNARHTGGLREVGLGSR